MATGIIAPLTLVAMIDAVRLEVGHVLQDGRLPLVIGGECPLLLGCLAAARDLHKQVGLVFVDGHEDAWPPHASETGEAADMELGFAIGFTKATIADLTVLLPLVHADDVVVLGPRDQEELNAAGVPSAASIVTFRDDEALRDSEIDITVGELTQRIHDTAGHWWFHLDLDVLATEALATVRYPQPRGLGWADLEAVTRAALRTPGLVGWNITIYNPDLDSDGSGATRIVSFVGAMTQHLV